MSSQLKFDFSPQSKNQYKLVLIRSRVFAQMQFDFESKDLESFRKKAAVWSSLTERIKKCC